MYKYKNISDNAVVIVGVGEVPAGAEFTSDQVILNKDIQLVDGNKSNSVVAVTQPQPNTVTEAEKVEPADNE